MRSGAGDFDDLIGIGIAVSTIGIDIVVAVRCLHRLLEVNRRTQQPSFDEGRQIESDRSIDRSTTADQGATAGKRSRRHAETRRRQRTEE